MTRNASVPTDLGDGRTAVCCLACLLALYRGRDRAAASRAARGHRCEPVVPLSRPGRSTPPPAFLLRLAWETVAHRPQGGGR